MPDFVPMPTTTALYAGILGLLSIVLGVLVGRLRGADGVSVGDGGRQDILVGMRRHANFVEWTPQALLLIGLLEMNKVSVSTIHIFGCVLVVARISHAIGMRADGSNTLFRAAGAVSTVILTLVLSVWAISIY